MNLTERVASVLAVVALYGCGTTVENTQHNSTSSILSTDSVTGVLLATDAADSTSPQLNLDVHFPVASGESESYPLIVFFHGALCAPAGYAELADYWASRGYVVIMPAHPDFGSQGRPNSERALKVFLAQIDEMSAIVTALDRIELAVPQIAGRVDPTRIAAAGHSMGALIAAAVAGLTRTGIDGKPHNFLDERFNVAVLLSGPGPLPNTPEGAWDNLQVPTIVTTGTADHANRGGDGADWQWRLGAFELTPAGDKFALIVDQADHFLGGKFCAERAFGKPDQQAFDIVASATTSFLDAYLRQSARAYAELQPEYVQQISAGRAELRLR